MRRYNKVKVIPYINAERKYNAELGAKEYVQVPNAAFQALVSKTFPDTATAKIMVACSVRPPLLSSPIGIVRHLFTYYNTVCQSITEQKQKQKARTNHKLGSNRSDPNPSL